MLSTVIMILHISSSDDVYLKTESSYPLLIFHYYPTPRPGNYFSLFLRNFGFLKTSPHICGTMQYLSFFVWLISLNVCPSVSPILLQMAGFPSLWWINNIPLYMDTYVSIIHSFSINLLIDTGFFCTLVPVKNNAMNKWV